MKNKVTIPVALFAFLAFHTMLFAQMTMTATDATAVNAVGNVITTYLDTLAITANIGSPGATSWDFSSLIPHYTTAYTSVVPASTPFFASDFSASNVAFHFSRDILGTSGEGWAYSAQSANAYEQSGEALTATGFIVKAVYAPVQLEFPLPFTMNSQWGSDFTIMDSVLYDGFPAVTTIANHTETAVVDAYGPLTLPGGIVLQALRIRRDDRYTSPTPPFYNRTISYSIVTKSGCVVEIVARDTTAPNSGIIQTEAIGWSTTTTGSGTPRVRLSATALDFGDVAIGQFTERPFTITNDGTDTLRVTSVTSNNPAFTVTPSSATLAPSQSGNVIVRFTAASAGVSNAVLLLSSNASSSPDQVSAQGTGTGSSGLQLSTSALSFGDVKLGEFKELTVKLTNSGNDTLRVSDIRSLDTLFSIQPNTLVISPNQDVIITIRFSPTLVGAVSSTCAITSNAPTSPDEVALSGNGTGTPMLQISQRSLSFGSVMIGQSKSLPTTISNTGTSFLSITGIASSNPAFVSSLNIFSLAPSASAVDTIHFSPTTAGTVTGIITVGNDSPNPSDTILVSGAGEATTPVDVAGRLLRFALDQNYPNPLSTSTTFPFTMPQSSHVLLEIYSLMGTKLRTLLDADVNGGEHRVQARVDLPNGMYYYRLRSRDLVLSKILTVLR